MADLTINGAPLANYGCVLEEAPQWLDSAQRTWPTVAIPGRDGVVKSSAVPVIGALQLQVKVLLRGASVADARDMLDRLKTALAAGPCALTWDDQATRRLVAEWGAVTSEPVGPQLLAAALPLTLTFACLDPMRQDVAQTNLGPVAAGVAVACPLGTAAAFPQLLVNGPAVNPVITLKDYTGTVRGSIGLTINLGAGEQLAVDCDALTITKAGASQIAALSSGDFPVLDPAVVANFPSALWPTLETSAGTLQVIYTKRWR